MQIVPSDVALQVLVFGRGMGGGGGDMWAIWKTDGVLAGCFAL